MRSLTSTRTAEERVPSRHSAVDRSTSPLCVGSRRGSVPETEERKAPDLQRRIDGVVTDIAVTLSAAAL